MKSFYLLPILITSSAFISLQGTDLKDLILYAKGAGLKPAALHLYTLAKSTNDPKLNLIKINLKAGSFATEAELNAASTPIATAATGLPEEIRKNAAEHPKTALAQVLQTSGVEAFKAAGISEPKVAIDACIRAIGA